MTEGVDRYARLAAQLLRAHSAQAEPPLTESRRDKLVAAMALAIAAKRRRRRAVMLGGIVLAAAAGILLLIKVGSNHKPAIPFPEATLLVEANTGPGNTLVRNDLQQRLVGGVRLVEGDSIEARKDGSATLGFANGTRVIVSAAGRLRVDELASTRRFSLQSGRLQAQVAKLGRGERFVIDTPDAEVEVRGTVFGISVEASEGCRGLTNRSTVAVSEGAVWVRSGTAQVLLHPGESWTSPCPDTPTTEAAGPEVLPTVNGTSVAVSRPEPRAAGRRTPAARPPLQLDHAAAVAPPLPAPPAPGEAPAPVRRESSLAEQNNLFTAAMAAEHQGDHATALGKLDQLIERFPTGPLLQSARAERERILSALPRP